MDTLKAHGEGGTGRVQGLDKPGCGLVHDSDVDGPAGFHVGHGQGIAKIPRGITAVMLDEVDLEVPGRFLGVFEPGNDREGTVEEVEGRGARSSADFHPLLRLVREPVNGAGTDFFELVGDHIGHRVCFCQPDEVKVVPEERGEEFSAGPVEVFPQQFERFRDRGIILWLVGSLFPAFFNRPDIDGLAVR
jgi:hypothetical protein